MLPGLDGTGELLEPLAESLGERARIVRYDPQAAIGYDALEAVVRSELPTAPFVLVAESFSGPLAVRIAASVPTRLVGLAFLASFVRSPRPAVAAIAARTIAHMGPPPAFVARALLAGSDAPDELVDRFRAAVGSVDPAVLRARLAAVAEVDERVRFASLDVPLLYLGARRDRLVPPSVAAAMLALQPSMTLRWLDAPHLVAQRATEEVARELRRFIEEQVEG